jgi:hypothetical protein
VTTALELSTFVVNGSRQRATFFLYCRSTTATQIDIAMISFRELVVDSRMREDYRSKDPIHLSNVPYPILSAQ